MPEAFAFAPEVFAGAADFAPEIGLAAADVGAETALGAETLAGGALGGALAGEAGGAAALDTGLAGAEAATAGAEASGIGGELPSPALSTQFGDPSELPAFDFSAGDTGGMMNLGGTTSDLGVAVDQGGLAGEFSADAAGPANLPDFSSTLPSQSDLGSFAASTDQATGGGVTDIGVADSGPTVTTTTGPAKAGGGLFGSGLNATQLATAALIGGMGLMPQPLSAPAKATQREAGILTSAGNENLARAAANQISPAQQEELQTIRQQLISQAVQQLARTSPGGQIDPQNDSRYLGMVAQIDDAIAKQYQAFVDAEASLGLQEVQAALGADQTLIQELARQDAALNAALLRAGLASGFAMGGGGGGQTTTTTVTS